jgi:outer membrane protein OmpU
LHVLVVCGPACDASRLIATTALVATAGVAAADITMGGWGFVGATSDGSETTATNGVRLTFTGTVETDSGVTFTAFGRLTQASNNAAGTTATPVLDADGDAVDPAATVATSNAAGMNYGRVSVAYSGLTVTVGNTHTAMNSYARGGHFWGYNDGGVWARTVQGSGMGSRTDSSVGSRVLASYSFGDFVVGLGGTFDGEEVDGASMDFGGRYSANGIVFGAAIDDDSNWQLEAGYTINQIGLRAAANSDDEFVVSASYAIDSALTVAVGYAENLDDGVMVDDIGLNLTYNLGGGATLSATAGQAGDDEVYGLGVQFSF